MGITESVQCDSDYKCVIEYNKEPSFLLKNVIRNTSDTEEIKNDKNKSEELKVKIEEKMKNCNICKSFKKTIQNIINDKNWEKTNPNEISDIHFINYYCESILHINNSYRNDLEAQIWFL